MTSQTQKQRITVKKRCANPLFEKWLTDWGNQAKENNSKMQYTFNNALKTLKKYPIELNSGKECLILKGFGGTLCNMLDKKLFEFKTNKGNSINETQIDVEPVQSNRIKFTKDNTKDTKSPKSSKAYLPVKRSGAYAILITLMKKSQEPNYSGSLTKNEIIEFGCNFCDKSFTKPDPGTFYTAWSSMNTLITKGFILKKGSPAKFSLTDEGEIIAIKLIETNDSSVPNNEMTAFVARSNILNDFNLQTAAISSKTENFCINLPSSEDVTSSQASSNFETIIFAPRTFDVIFLVDTQETTGGTRNPSDDETISELKRLNVNFEVRHLKIGDFTWICREKSTKQELILPFIAERKRMDDLGHSIKDGRFHEQKFRLKQCGIQNLIYIVESYGNNSRTVLPLTSLMQGATNTLIQEEFQVKFTENQRHSMQYLSGFTLMLKHIFEEKTIVSCLKENLTPFNISEDLISLMSFKEFNKGASKIKMFKVKDVFVRQLLQLKGISVEKALAIVQKYQTPKLLKIEYGRLGVSQGEKILAGIQFGPLKKTIGPVISKSVYQLYTMNKLL